MGRLRHQTEIEVHEGADGIMRYEINGEKFFEKCFPLTNDPELDAAGMFVCARVGYGVDGDVRNRIVFNRRISEDGDLIEASVNCVHTAVYEGTLDGIPGECDFARSTEGRPVDLPPEEHFFALQSYVQGIAEAGIANMVLSSYEGGDPFTLPFGFNSAMQQQVLKALNALDEGDNRVVDSFVLGVLEDLSRSAAPGWLRRRKDLIDTTYGTNKRICTNVALAESYIATFGGPGRATYLKCPNLFHPDDIVSAARVLYGGDKIGGKDDAYREIILDPDVDVGTKFTVFEWVEDPGTVFKNKEELRSIWSDGSTLWALNGSVVSKIAPAIGMSVASVYRDVLNSGNLTREQQLMVINVIPDGELADVFAGAGQSDLALLAERDHVLQYLHPEEVLKVLSGKYRGAQFASVADVALALYHVRHDRDVLQIVCNDEVRASLPREFIDRIARDGMRTLDSINPHDLYPCLDALPDGLAEEVLFNPASDARKYAVPSVKHLNLHEIQAILATGDASLWSEIRHRDDLEVPVREAGVLYDKPEIYRDTAMEALLTRYPVSKSVVEFIANGPKDLVSEHARSAIAQRTDLSAADYNGLLANGDWQTLDAVLMNPELPTDTVEMLVGMVEDGEVAPSFVRNQRNLSGELRGRLDAAAAATKLR